ncbi:MAG TPA: helix-turn-helix transcriptional regulator [Dehalococcoidia bacterium]|nr:helix-turn-helix transcriptional regulator [Dehalococcoidia bacterium]
MARDEEMRDGKADGRTNGARAESPFRLHGDLLTTTLLAFLRNWNAYGYQLAQKLAEAGLPAFDSGTVYRTLRQLERAGFVSSFWDTSESGPARRMYSLTRAGEIFLSGWIEVLGKYQAVLQETLAGMEGVDAAAASSDDPPGGEDARQSRTSARRKRAPR